MDFGKIMRVGLSNPSLLGRKISQFYNRTRTGVNFNPDGIDIFDADWDNLLLLDACRYDLLDRNNDFGYPCQSVTSKGSATPEFLRGNFRGRELTDTVYVTANPMLYRYTEEIDVTFHNIENLWAGQEWDDEIGTVLPEDVASETKRIHDIYSNKRILVHFMQPHYPFIDSELKFDKGHLGADAPDGMTTWMQVMTGQVDISREKLWAAYERNLQRALPHVHDLVDSLPGKMVVTSDHGNMFGERASPVPIQEWGHPPSIWIEELVRVPWIEIPDTERKEVVSESPVGDLAEDTAVESRLESLGYLE